MNTSAIHLERLSTGYRGKHEVKTVARDITADICRGELTCLLGANGSGKSTLLRTLSAFQPALSGKIRICGKELEEYTDKELARVIGVVLTDRLGVRNMTVEELVGMGRSPYTGFWGALHDEDREIINRSMSEVNLLPLKDRMVHTLSDGERQKVMIAKVLAQDTPVIFLDEPTAFLDYPSKVEIMQLLHRISREMNKTIFLSTHDLELALQIADKIWLLRPGEGVRTGVPEDLSLDGSLARFFDRKGISFDMDSGLFRINHHPVRSIRTTGEGFRKIMMDKALRRNSYSTDVPEDFLPAIRCTEKEYLLTLPDGTARSAELIEEILSFLKEV